MPGPLDGKSVAALRGRALHPTCGHLADYAAHIIPPGVPMASGALLAAYRNAGNEIDASSEAQRRAEVIKCLDADPRLEYDADADAFWIEGTRPAPTVNSQADEPPPPAPAPEAVAETPPAVDPPAPEAAKDEKPSKGSKKS